MAEDVTAAAAPATPASDRFSVDELGRIIDSAAGGRYATFGVDPANEEQLQYIRGLCLIFNVNEDEAARFGWIEGAP
jgi:hypothetical protein